MALSKTQGIAAAVSVIVICGLPVPDLADDASDDSPQSGSDGLQRSCDSGTYSHVEYVPDQGSVTGIDVLAGSSCTYTVLYEIPSASTVADPVPSRSSPYGYAYVRLRRGPGRGPCPSTVPSQAGCSRISTRGSAVPDDVILNATLTYGLMEA